MGLAGRLSYEMAKDKRTIVILIRYCYVSFVLCSFVLWTLIIQGPVYER